MAACYAAPTTGRLLPALGALGGDDDYKHPGAKPSGRATMPESPAAMPSSLGKGTSKHNLK